MAHAPAMHATVRECEIVCTANYNERLTLRRLPSMPQYAVLEITSQMDSARDPLQRQTRYRCVITEEALQTLQQMFASGALSAETA